MATLGSKSVGSIVKLKVDGVATDFIIVHQGNPDTSMYDSSCNGTWLLMKDIYEKMMWGNIDQNYYESDIHTYLNGTFLNLFDSNIKSAIKQVKIPYSRQSGFGTKVYSGTDGLSTRIFLLGGYEVGFSKSDSEKLPIDGAKLSYFGSGTGTSAKNKRIANYNGKATIWWLRSSYKADASSSTLKCTYTVTSDGNCRSEALDDYAYGVRPALILPSSLLVSSDGTVITNNPPSAPSSITVPTTVKGGESATISWTASSDSDGNLSGYILQRSVNSGTFSQIYKGTSRTFTDSITKGWNTVQYRVKAYDPYAESDYTTSASRTVINNTAPTITSDKTGNLGTLTSGFTCNYSVNDVDAADNVTVTLSMDSTAVKTFVATKNQQETYSLTGEEWLKITNGSHTFKIAASDGKDSATSTATFTRNCNKLTVTLAEPLVADASTDLDARISACALTIEGFFPTDAIVTYEVTNNAKDDTSVWEDCSAKVKAGFPYMFTNKTAQNGYAFNFRITAERGVSGAGGYITKISGGFQ